MNIRYKDYDLDAAPAKSYGKDEWMTSVHINKLSADGYKTKAFYCKETFDTKEEAEEHTMTLGKQIVDGEHPDFKIDF
ncbi:MAG: hypothetical protein HON76_04315 [Candidatus Scalindua sp.]|jgi:hypothetical protein|nr:hypothetical protein [Candidatus Scalindua sp.]MBT5304696.1 hypothetical protein [Candidatus Scalindua sp.]MBT6051192.1 hypothetical protein [Candidatus Scalindua sp.]MBT6227527.1 hypothetical protein [Candidatus Scalindua sp.]MBT6561735.1 hypothetical protein [Candidatus Scalindua sp.]